jgi:type IV pilus assembly protein PilQ
LVVAAVIVAGAMNGLAGVPGVVRLRAAAPGAETAPVLTGPQLRAVSATLGDGSTTLTIEASDPVAYLMNQPDPFTLIIDLRNARLAGAVNNVQSRFGHVAGVTLEDGTTPDGTKSARVRVRFTGVLPYNVRSSQNIIVVEVGKGGQLATTTVAGAFAAPAVPASMPRPAGAADAAVASRLSAISAEPYAGGTVLALVGNGRLVARSVQATRESPSRIVVEFPNVTPGVPSVTELHEGPIDRVHVDIASRDPLVTRVVLDLNREASYWVQPPEDDSSEFRMVFQDAPAVADNGPTFAAQIGERRPVAPPEPMTALTLRTVAARDGAAVAAAVGSLLALPPATPVPAPAPGIVLSPAPAATRVVAPVPAPAPAGPAVPVPGSPAAAVMQLQAAGAQAPAVPEQLGRPIGQARVFTGQAVILDFQGADLRAVLRTFSEISGLNMVIDPTVQGSVDVALRDVPWDQALDIILRANRLGYVIDGTIVRIAPLTVLSDEEAQRRKLAEEQALAGELRVFTRSLSYARAEDMAPLLTRAALTSRGTVQVDARTNTLIVTDLPIALQTVGDLIATLDRAQPQVEIEARIVQTTRDFARAIGVQWGFNGRVAQDLGNTTGLAFPNQGTLTGRATGTSQGVPLGQPTDSALTAINLGVDGAANAIGLALGSVNGAVNLDLALTAMEGSGQGRLLSTPRVSTQNNVEAEITQGVQIPIQTVANNTVTVTFKDAALTLKVTPQITASDTVIMRINVENASPNFSQAINNIPPIDTQRAVTQVLVSDGQTTVIGGIYTSRQESNVDQTPGLHRIPLLGWLFKRESMNDESRELLIFITPRIIRT